MGLQLIFKNIKNYFRLEETSIIILVIRKKPKDFKTCLAWEAE